MLETAAVIRTQDPIAALRSVSACLSINLQILISREAHSNPGKRKSCYVLIDVFEFCGPNHFLEVFFSLSRERFLSRQIPASLIASTPSKENGEKNKRVRASGEIPC